MQRITLSKEMEGVLSGMKGKALKSFEYIHELGDGQAYGVVRLNMGRSSVELTNVEAWFEVFGRIEGIPVFSCAEASRKDPFQPYGLDYDKPPRVYLVDERVEGVQIVRDEVRVSRDDGTGEHVLVDQAIRIITPRTVLTFWRDWFYSEVIRIDAGPVPCEIMPVEKVKYDWGDEGEDPVEVKRTVIEL